MRLSCIKLAGFKSFVEPTVVRFPSQLCGVVGPNGCGKSNIIDAVRWVMGESSAKHLRGESLTDVIFNGSTTRKPIGQATIELIFDNSEGKLVGQCAGFQEISIKRKVTREGVSAYYLNNTRCRRRDITDIFLGTGLGPRSYAIIEQGMISRLVEAKPDELRHYLEEAAGISKYKERRRETENRISHTRENLDRLNDLRDELGRHLQHLQRQANAAEKYKVLKQEQSTFKAQLFAMRWRSLDSENQQLSNQIQQTQTNLEAKTAKQRHTEADIEKQRQFFAEQQEEFNQIQGDYYQVGAEIARIEQTIEHHKERRKQLTLDLERIEAGFHEASQHLADDQRNLIETTSQLDELMPALELVMQKETQDANILQSLDEKLQQWQKTWDEFNQLTAQTTQTAQVEQTNIQHAEQSITDIEKRIKALLQGHDELVVMDVDNDLVSKTETLESELSAMQQKRQSLLESIAGEKGLRGQVQQNIETIKGELQKLSGRQASIEALQQQALNQSSNELIQWLRAKNIDDNPRLFSQINVTAGWEKAVEIVLENHLEAICVESLRDVVTWLDDSPNSKLSFYESVQTTNAAHADSQTLRQVVQSEIAIPSFLSSIYLADSLESALNKREQLQPHESFITQDGQWVGKHWLRVYANAQENGVLYRKQLLEQLQKTISIEEGKCVEEEIYFQRRQETIASFEAELEQLQLSIQKTNQLHVEHQAQIKAKQAQKNQIELQQKRMQEELSSAQNQLDEKQGLLKKSRSVWQEALTRLEQQASQKDNLLIQKEQLRSELELHRGAHQQSRENHHKLALKQQDLSGKRQSFEVSIERLSSQTNSLQQRKQDIHSQLNQDETPVELYEQQLKEKLAHHVTVEEKLKSVRELFEKTDVDLKAYETERLSIERQINDVREVLNQKRMDAQTLLVRQKTIEEQLVEDDFSIQVVLESLPDEAEIDSWTEFLEKITQKIQRLGAINLAAIDELAQESERKDYLDQQNDDLIAALETLETAIQKIDQETRSRFKETFTTVNNSLEKLFPKVFGGGQASLVMVENDLLNTGIELIARPPGKRNSTIHLLSGGEKALTAIALIFSIFQLNPSPFCMLDEVDAPLDDFNVGRYASLLQEMSDTVQFIFITHNKVTMEIANHLLGVTMHEPGVSRLVAVDVDEAASMAVA